MTWGNKILPCVCVGLRAHASARSKYPNCKALGYLKPQYLGTWTLRVRF